VATRSEEQPALSPIGRPRRAAPTVVVHRVKCRYLLRHLGELVGEGVDDELEAIGDAEL